MKRVATTAILIAICAIAGVSCRSVVPFIKSKKTGVEVVGNKDAGTPATSDTSTTKEIVAIPAGSTITKTVIAATPQEPAKEVTEVKVTVPTEIVTNRVTEKLSTGTIDTTVAQRRIEIEAESENKRPILYTAIGLLVLAIALFALLPQWKGLYTAAGIGSALTFAAWKLSDIPAWAGAVLLLVVGLVALGYKKGEIDKNGDGIPDILQRNHRK